MELELSDDQVALRDELRRMLATRCTPEVRRAAMDRPGAVDPDLWAALRDMGAFDLAEPGSGFGLADAAIAAEELGVAAAPGPLVASMVVGGGAVANVVERAEPALVEHLDALDRLLVLEPDGTATEVDRPAAPPVDRPLDPLTPVSVVTLGPGRPTDHDAARLRRDGAVLAAAMQVGLGQGALDLAVAYAKARHQFGRPIGSFQALKHLLADAAVGLEVARAAVHAAAVGVDEGDGTGVDGARVVASRAATVAATTSIQVHGGIGYTWELDAHLFLKRILVLDQFLTTPDRALDAIAAKL